MDDSFRRWSGGASCGTTLSGLGETLLSTCFLSVSTTASAEEGRKESSRGVGDSGLKADIDLRCGVLGDVIGRLSVPLEMGQLVVVVVVVVVVVDDVILGDTVLVLSLVAKSSSNVT